MKIEELRTLIHNGVVPQSDTFARDLLKSFDRYHRLTEKQAPWVDRKVEQYTQPRPATQALDANVLGLFTLFQRASDAGLRFPKIRIETNAGQYLVLARCGERSRYEGQVQITDGGPFGNSLYFGRIDTKGALQPGKDLNHDVRAMIGKLASNPAETAAIYGRKTGQCCFCNRALDDGRSIEVGYGPVCAEKYGLPWGGKKVDTRVVVKLDEINPPWYHRANEQDPETATEFD